MAAKVNPISPADVNMKVNIAGVEFNNPVTVASGTFGSGMEYCEYVDLGKLGAVTTKGVLPTYHGRAIQHQELQKPMVV